MKAAIVNRAVQEITGCKYFFSQDESYCIGALQCAARSLGLRLADAEARRLIPDLRAALSACAEVKP